MAMPGLIGRSSLCTAVCMCVRHTNTLSISNCWADICALKHKPDLCTTSWSSPRAFSLSLSLSFLVFHPLKHSTIKLHNKTGSTCRFSYSFDYYVAPLCPAKSESCLTGILYIFCPSLEIALPLGWGERISSPLTLHPRRELAHPLICFLFACSPA